MKAAVYFGPQDIRATTVDDPKITQPHELLVRVKTTSICGSDLHLYRGAFDGIMERGKSRTGHELVGEVVEAGRSAGSFRAGDVVSMGYSVSCGECFLCRAGQTAHCETTKKAVYGFGAAFGDVNGTHAEALVLPHAAAHTVKLPAGIDAASAAILSCNLPTAVIANRLADPKPGETIALVGCGPTGLMTLDVARLREPGRVFAIDPVAERRAEAAKRGAVAIDPAEPDWKKEVLDATQGRGVDKVFEVVGLPEAFQIALDLARPGATIAAMGVFAAPSFDLNLADVFLRDLSLHLNGFANVQPALRPSLELLEQGRIRAGDYFSHDFALADVDQAFRTFWEKRSLKVRITP